MSKVVGHCRHVQRWHLQLPKSRITQVEKLYGELVTDNDHWLWKFWQNQHEYEWLFPTKAFRKMLGMLHSTNSVVFQTLQLKNIQKTVELVNSAIKVSLDYWLQAIIYHIQYLCWVLFGINYYLNWPMSPILLIKSWSKNRILVMDSKFDFNWSHWAGFKEHGGQVHMCKTLDHSVTRGQVTK